MNLKKFLTPFLLLTALLPKTIHYHFHLNPSPSSKSSHKSQKSHKSPFNLKNFNDMTVNTDLLMKDLSEFKLGRENFFDKEKNKHGYIITKPGGYVLSHAFKRLKWIKGYQGLGEFWNVEREKGSYNLGFYYRADGKESDLYLSSAGGQLGLSHSKGSSELWNNNF